MKVLIAEDDPISRKLLEAHLSRAGYGVVSTANGADAWDALCAEGAPKLAILDWMMPAMDGIEICRRARIENELSYVYLILLTAKTRDQDKIEGFRAGADDYLTKPFAPHDLRARVAVGKRIIELQCALQSKIEQLRVARGDLEELQGLLPICMHCKKIRDDRSTWHQLEVYIERHSRASFTHSLCEPCLEQHYPDLADDAVT